MAGYLLKVIVCCLYLSNRVTSIENNEITPNCKPEADICELPPITIHKRLSMMLYDDTNDVGYPIVDVNGELRKRTQCSSVIANYTEPLSAEELSKVNTVDGTYRFLFTINGQYPGPTFVVYEGQELVINVTNELSQEGTGVHWHGIHQINSNWMDGVPGITMCPINAGETFMYRFKASPAGTHWYHSHYSLQRIDGIFGAFIVLPKPNKKDNGASRNNNSPYPHFSGDFLMMVNDFYPENAEQLYFKSARTLLLYPDNKYGGTKCNRPLTKTMDGTRAGDWDFYSILINGKGRRNDSPRVPLEEYQVHKNKYYRFRIINSGMAFPLKISIDKHKLVVIGTECDNIRPQKTDSIIVGVGERYDIYIHTNQRVGNYWIRVQTLEDGVQHDSLAILRYSGSSNTNPKSTGKRCTQNNKCTAVNCPFKYLQNSTCINVGDLKSSNNQSHHGTDNFVEHFLYFDFTEWTTGFHGGVNGIRFSFPTHPPALLGYTQYEKDCANISCYNNQCVCTHQIYVKLGQIVQLNLFAKRMAHPVHIHGHMFEVLKVGYPRYNSRLEYTDHNDDVTCNNSFCQDAGWSNSDWLGGHVPGVNNINPVSKDTIVIPAGGYVVVRFKAKNPGWWLLHCHLDMHFADGMGMLIQSGTESDMIRPPDNMPTCGSFFHSGNNLKNSKKVSKISATSRKEDTTEDRSNAGIIIGGVSAGILLTVVIVVLSVFIYRKYGPRPYLRL